LALLTLIIDVTSTVTWLRGVVVKVLLDVIVTSELTIVISAAIVLFADFDILSRCKVES